MKIAFLLFLFHFGEDAELFVFHFEFTVGPIFLIFGRGQPRP
jgi:hypothetical protein